MQMYLIRHGETDWSSEGSLQADSDRPLNENGRRQAEAIAKRLCDMDFEAVYSSTCYRAYETAAIIAKKHGLDVQTIESLVELHQGMVEGFTYSELAANYAEFLQEWYRGPVSLKVPGGESLQEVQTRAVSALKRITQRHPSGKVVVVGHNLCNITLLCWAMNLDLDKFRQIRQDLAAINVLEFRDHRSQPVIMQLNDTSHICSN